MPSLRHDVLAWAVPRVRGARAIDSPEAERARLEAWHATLGSGLPSQRVRGFRRQVSVTTETLEGPAGGFPCYTLTPRDLGGAEPGLTVVYVHGGGFVSPMDRFHVVYAARLARTLRARVVMPTYPLAPEHSFRDSHDALAGLVARWADSGRTVLAGDSAGGGYALALAETLRERGGAQVDRLLLISPWVDLTTSTADETSALDPVDPWLSLGKLQAYATWWAGSAGALSRHEVSPALAPLAGLPPALMFCGTRDLLSPGCRLLARRAADEGWDLTYVEVEDLIHVYPILPFVPEARLAWRQTLEFLG